MPKFYLSDIFITSLAKQYPVLGKIINIEPVSGGFANNNYSLRTSSSKYFLKIIPQRQEQSIPRQLFFYNAITYSKVATIYPIKDKIGNLISKVGNQFVTLFPYVNINQPKITLSSAERIAQLTGMLHVTSFPKELVKIPSRYGKEIALDNLKRLDKTELEKYRKYFMYIEALDTNLPKGFVFNDICPDNLYAVSGELRGFIDPENAGIGEFLLDIASATIMCFFPESEWLNLTRTFLSTYEKYRVLTESEKDNFFNALIFSCVNLSLFFELKFTSRSAKKIQERLIYADGLVEIGKKEFIKRIFY